MSTLLCASWLKKIYISYTSMGDILFSNSSYGYVGVPHTYTYYGFIGFIFGLGCRKRSRFIRRFYDDMIFFCLVRRVRHTCPPKSWTDVLNFLGVIPKRRKSCLKKCKIHVKRSTRPIFRMNNDDSWTQNTNTSQPGTVDVLENCISDWLI